MIANTEPAALNPRQQISGSEGTPNDARRATDGVTPIKFGTTAGAQSSRMTSHLKMCAELREQLRRMF